jgi:hypothetical protein
VVTLAYQASERWAYERTIEQLNQSLEQRVEARTKELKKRNRQF